MPATTVSDLEARLRMIEDRLDIYNLIAGHPPSADTGADYYTRAVYLEDGAVDFGGRQGRKRQRSGGGHLAHRRAPGGDRRRSRTLCRPAARHHRRR